MLVKIKTAKAIKLSRLVWKRLMSVFEAMKVISS